MPYRRAQSVNCKSQSGAALVITLAILVLVTVLVLTLFLTVTNERVESAASANQGDAQRLASGVVDLVKATITQATMGYQANADGTPIITSPTAWASQPGLIRTWDQGGNYYKSYRLYSSGSITETNQTNLLTDTTALLGWKSGSSSTSYNALWCDLNAPAPNATNGLTYPIVTPPADANSGSTATDTNYGVPTANPSNTIQAGVQGFSITNSPGYSSGSTIAPTNNPAPMPVQWLYVLRDGSFVSPTGGINVATIAGATSNNPIIGRVAYWTDDETCKININTASEGVYWDKPYGVNPEDSGTTSVLGYSISVPAKDEFQRLPGHPAFTSLSAVYGGWLPRPDIGFSSSGANGAAAYTGGTYAANILPYFSLSPRIGDGGTQGGTRQVLTTNASTMVTLDSDRLYAAADEFLYSPTNSAGARVTNNSSLTPNVLQKTSFFVTATSKAPETTLFEKPRISLWPIQQSTATQNAKDQLLAFASTINSNSLGTNSHYYFQRASTWTADTSPGSSQSTTTDVTLPRNVSLLNYLYYSAQQQVPGFGAILSNKYPNGTLPQILIEMFDTIRSLVNTTSFALPTNSAAGYSYAPFTNTIIDANHPVVGLGSVVPTLTTLGGYTVKGFGRFPTINEVVIVFMASRWASNTVLAPSRDWADLAYNINYNSNPNIITWPNRQYPDWVPSWGDSSNTPIASLDSNGLATLTPRPSGPYPLLTKDLPNDIPAYTGATPNYTLDPTSGLITSLNGTGWVSTNSSNSVGFNGVGDPQTTAIRAFVFLIPINPAPGQPDTAPAVRYQIDGLDQFQITSGGITQNLGFPSKNNAVLITRGNNRKFSQPEGEVESQFVYGYGGGTIGFARQAGNCDGTTATSANNDTNLANYPFVGSSVSLGVTANPGRFGLDTNGLYMDMRPSVTPTTMSFSGGTLKISIFPGTGAFDTNNFIQEIDVNFPNATLPVPLVTRSSFYIGPSGVSQDFNTNASLTNAYTNAFYGGFSGTDGDSRDFNKRLNCYITGFNSGIGAEFPGSVIRRGDVLRSVFLDPAGPALGDIRVLAGLQNAPQSFFTTFPGYTNINLLQACGAAVRVGPSSTYRTSMAYDNASNSINPYNWARQQNRGNSQFLGKLGTNSYNSMSIAPNVPYGMTNAPLPNGSPGDWNTGVGGSFDGPYINMGEQGFAADTNNGYNNIYFPANSVNYTSQYQNTLGTIVTSFSPNRQIYSPVLFGSLPTGITAPLTNNATSINQAPWQTLLFCPNPAAGNNHPGFATGAGGPGPNAVPPFSTAPDHLFLDYFWMPVVEPYAISEPFATAGKVNLNTQIAPFNYIQRSTGLYAVLKALKMAAIPNALSGSYKRWDLILPSPGQTGANNPSWRYNIDVDAIAAGMNANRFANNDIYHSASEVCSIFMVPSLQPGSAGSTTPAGPSGATALTRYNNTAAWWADKTLTGDNLRESPYDQIYSRITTKSNTFTIHMRVQGLKQVPGWRTTATNWGTWDESKDQVVSEYRGSATIERYVDPNDTSIPDFALPANYTKNLAPYYRWRTVAERQFLP